MGKKRILAIVMAVLMIITLLPSMVFASAPSGELDGKLKIKGLAAVGTKLSADYTKVKPEGITDDYVSFQWCRQESETVLTEVGTEKDYTVTEEDLGYVIVLKITGREDMGITGTLLVKTPQTAATEEEAKELAKQQEAQEEANSETVEGELELQEEGAADAELQVYNEEELQETIPDENDDAYAEELPSENIGNAEETDAAQDTAQEGYEEIPEGTEVVYDESGNPVQTEEELMPAAEEDIFYEAQAVIENESGVLDFGTVEAGSDVEVQYVTVTNTGAGVLNFDEISQEHFMAEDISEPLAPGESVSLWVKPREENPAGTYDDILTYTTQEGAEVSFGAKVTVGMEEDKSDENPAEEPELEPAQDPVSVYSLEADMNVMIFGNLKEGYSEISEKQIVTIQNTGDSMATVKLPVSEYFDIQASGESNVLDAGAEAAFSIQPKLGLTQGSYQETLTFGVEEEPSAVVSISAEVVVEAGETEVISVQADPSVVSFQALKEGYEETETQEIILTNTGNTEVSLEQPLAEYFDVGALQADTLAPGEAASFTVTPKKGLAEGIYDEDISIRKAGAEEGEEHLAKINVNVTVEKEEKNYKLSVSPSGLDFGSVEAGYEEAPKSQKVTVTNEGNTTVTLEQPTAQYFRIGSLSADVLAPGESCTFAVRPKSGLEESTYVETIIIPNEEGIAAQTDAQFTVTVASINLTGIVKPEDITGLKNGVKKSAAELGLPSQVTIKTTGGKMKAVVQWNVKGCSYDPDSKEAQTFKVNGKVTLPDGIMNPDEISLITSVNVSVKAAYVPKIADPSDNKITGIASEGYTTQSKITFTAVGAGMDNTSPRKGDVRYEPDYWKVINTNSWKEAPYSATFGITKAGTYTLTVVFSRQQYNGEKWEATGEQDTKQMNFKIDQGAVVTATPAAQQKDANKRTAVLTGDTTPILPFVIILIAAVVCIAGVLVFRKKKK